jgi:hypothetical protein
MPAESDLQPIIEEYQRQFQAERGVEPLSRRTDTLGQRSHASLVLGTPFQAQLAFRLISEWKFDKIDLVRNQTTLLKSLIDLVTRDADRPSDRSSNTLAFFHGSPVANYAFCYVERQRLSRPMVTRVFRGLNCNTG